MQLKHTVIKYNRNDHISLVKKTQNAMKWKVIYDFLTKRWEISISGRFS